MAERSTYLKEDEILDFGSKVLRLREEGLQMVVIASRLGIPRTTLNERFRRYRELVVKTRTHTGA